VGNGVNPYAADKVMLHTDRVLALRQGTQPAPVHAHFVLSDLCNQDCNFCAYRMSGYTSAQRFPEVRTDGSLVHNPNRRMPTDKACEILTDLAALGVRAVQFTGGGEPTVHKEFLAVLRYAHSLGLDTALVTNGVRMGEAVRAELARSTWVRVSLDSGTPESYAAIRRVDPGTFHKVLANVEELAKLRDATGSQLYVGVGFVVTRENWHEVELAARLARDAGADNLRLSALFTEGNADYFQGFDRAAAAACERATRLTGGGFVVSNRFDERLSDLQQGSPDYRTCHYQHFTTYIGADLNVYRCCVYAYNDRGLVGSLKDQRFRELWEGSHKRADYSGFDARGCVRCQFNEKNRAIANAVATLPVFHGNFV